MLPPGQGRPADVLASRRGRRAAAEERRAGQGKEGQCHAKHARPAKVSQISRAHWKRPTNMSMYSVSCETRSATGGFQDVFLNRKEIESSACKSLLPYFRSDCWQQQQPRLVRRSGSRLTLLSQPESPLLQRPAVIRFSCGEQESTHTVCDLCNES